MGKRSQGLGVLRWHLNQRLIWGIGISLSVWQSAAVGESIIKKEKLTIQGVTEFLQNHPHIDNSHDFLASLPKEYRSEYSLVTNSQTGGPDRTLVSNRNPRIILHGTGLSSDPSGKTLMMGIIPGSSNVELIEFDGKSFNPGLIKFRRTSRSAQGYSPKAPAFLHGSVVACFKCHSGKKEELDENKDKARRRRRFRPNWETYPFWTGILGFTDKFANELAEAKENERIVLFQKSLPLDGTSPYDLLHDIQHQTVFSLSQLNTRFTTRLSELNSTRISSILTEHPDFAKYSASFDLFRRSANNSDFAKLATELSALSGEPAEEIEAALKNNHQIDHIDLTKYDQIRRNRQEKILGISLPKMTELKYDFPYSHRNTLLHYIVSKMDPGIEAESSSWPMTFHENYPMIPPAFTDGVSTTMKHVGSNLGNFITNCKSSMGAIGRKHKSEKLN